MRVALLVSSLVAVAVTQAAAAPPAYHIVTKDFSLWVADGSRRAPLGIGGSLDSDAATIDAKARTVMFAVLANCGSDQAYTFTFDQLEARLVNAEALVAHKHKLWAKAAAGFAHAVQLDPAWRLPAYNLASARTLLGDKVGAVAALAPWLATEPVATYVQVTFDPELAPLLVTKELAAVRAPTTGNVHVTVDGIDASFGIDAAHRLVAGVIDDSNGMSCDVTTSIALFDARRGMVIAKLPLSVRDGCEQGRPALLAPGRDVELQKLLTELGIIGTSFETARSVSLRDDGTRGVRLPRSKLGVVEGGQGVNVLRGNTTVATGPKSEPRLIGATFVPDAHLLVIESYRPIDGCPDNGLDALVLPP